MLDNPDQRMEDAEPPNQDVCQAAPRQAPPGRPYHEEIAPEMIDELALAIGKGLALVEVDENANPRRIIDAIARFVDEIGAKKRRLPSDAADAALALACLYGQALGRALGWGWAHVRRTRSPGIVLVSPGGRYIVGPRAIVDRALESSRGELLVEFLNRLERPTELPDSAPGRYVRIR